VAGALSAVKALRRTAACNPMQRKYAIKFCIEYQGYSAVVTILSFKHNEEQKEFVVILVREITLDAHARSRNP
jgi:hypothetical protein